ncbi:MAG TPA: CoA-binding protein [Coxiellaceae bacterium]|nr:CoA-binding protein [Coxiellaceae bacterium]
MMQRFLNWIMTHISHWLLKDRPIYHRPYLCDFEQISKKIKVGDVLLIEGHNHIGTIIRHVTQSPWTHAALYIGRISELEDPKSRELLIKQLGTASDEQFVIESNLGCGTIISPLTHYKNDNIRVLHPQALTREDAQKVVAFAVSRLGSSYDIRHVLDLARFLFPWGLFPRKWRSSLFEHNASQPTKDICSSMIAESFAFVDYPILPLIEEGYQNKVGFIRRNDRLYTPSDFDYSPYFDIIKYPFFPLGKQGAYHNLPWLKDVVSDDDGANIIFLEPRIRQFFSSEAYGVVGASANRHKIGNQVLRCYLQKGKKVYPINLHEKFIEGLACVAKISDLPNTVKSISVITQPEVTEKIVDEAIQKGIQNIWMQPGSESKLAIEKCMQNHINIIDNGVCILQELGFRDDS